MRLWSCSQFRGALSYNYISRAVPEVIFFGAALILNTLAKAASNQSGGNLT